MGRRLPQRSYVVMEALVAYNVFHVEATSKRAALAHVRQVLDDQVLTDPGTDRPDPDVEFAAYKTDLHPTGQWIVERNTRGG